MLRRTLLALPLAALAVRAGSESLRGRLMEGAVLDSGGRRVALEGEPETMAVLADARLVGADLELIGGFTAPGRFAIGPFYQSKSMFVHRGGKRYTISYWCEICSIRTYTPGKCMCCQEETELSLQEFPPR
jgi:hypothetical protein